MLRSVIFWNARVGSGRVLRGMILAVCLLMLASSVVYAALKSFLGTWVAKGYSTRTVVLKIYRNGDAVIAEEHVDLRLVDRSPARYSDGMLLLPGTFAPPMWYDAKTKELSFDGDRYVRVAPGTEKKLYDSIRRRLQEQERRRREEERRKNEESARKAAREQLEAKAMGCARGFDASGLRAILDQHPDLAHTSLRQDMYSAPLLCHLVAEFYRKWSDVGYGYKSPEKKDVLATAKVLLDKGASPDEALAGLAVGVDLFLMRYCKIESDWYDLAELLLTHATEKGMLDAHNSLDALRKKYGTWPYTERDRKANLPEIDKFDELLKQHGMKPPKQTQGSSHP